MVSMGASVVVLGTSVVVLGASVVVLVDDLGAAERALYRVLVGATALLAVLGSTASILDIAKHFDSSGTPFSC